MVSSGSPHHPGMWLFLSILLMEKCVQSPRPSCPGSHLQAESSPELCSGHRSFQGWAETFPHPGSHQGLNPGRGRPEFAASALRPSQEVLLQNGTVGPSPQTQHGVCLSRRPSADPGGTGDKGQWWGAIGPAGSRLWPSPACCASCHIQPAGPPWAAPFLNAGLGFRVCAHSGTPLLLPPQLCQWLGGATNL